MYHQRCALACLLLTVLVDSTLQNSSKELREEHTELVRQIVSLLDSACDNPATSRHTLTVTVIIDSSFQNQSATEVSPLHRVVTVPLRCRRPTTPTDPGEEAAPHLQSIQRKTGSPSWQLCAAWTVFWLLVHCACHWAPLHVVLLGATAFLKLRWDRVQPLRPRRARWRHLARCQIYNACAVIAGCALTSQYHDIRSLSTLFSWWHEVVFSCAFGHWTVSLVEHLLDTSSLNRLSTWYRLHHVAAAAVYAGCLWTQRMSAVGVGGLIFELPVAFENVSAALRWRRSLNALTPEQVRSLWDVTHQAMILGRALPLCIFLYSLIHWQNEWQDVPHAEFWRAAFGLFAVFSIGWVFVLRASRDRDVAEAEALEQATVPRLPGGERPATELTEGDDLLEDARQTTLGGGAPANAANATAAEVPPDSCDAAAHGLAEVAPAELEQHSSPSSCWVTLHGAVYDATDFLARHPGGAARILAFAGGDASEAFAEVGHSAAARRQLSAMLVGRLAGGGGGGSRTSCEPAAG